MVVISDTVIRKGSEVCAHQPRVSVIIPAYNVSAYIADTLQSVFSQSFKDFEVVLVNDGSSDTIDLELELKPFIDRIVYITQANAGPGPARNTAISVSRGEIIAFLDGDDIWLPNYLQSQLDQLVHRDLDMVYSNADLFGEAAPKGQSFMDRAPSKGDVTFESLLGTTCNVILSGTVARKSAVTDVGMFRSIPRGQDYDLWLRMAHAGARIGYQRERLLKYRVRQGSVSGDSIDRIERELTIYRGITEALDLSVHQLKIVERQQERLTAELNIEQAKGHILAERFADAEVALRSANQYRRSFHLSFLLLVLKFAPQPFSWFFRRRRKNEIKLIRTSEIVSSGRVGTGVRHDGF